MKSRGTCKNTRGMMCEENKDTHDGGCASVRNSSPLAPPNCETVDMTNAYVVLVFNGAKLVVNGEIVRPIKVIASPI